MGHGPAHPSHGHGGENGGAGHRRAVCQLHPPKPARRRRRPARAGPACRPEHHRGRVCGRKLKQQRKRAVSEASPLIESNVHIGPDWPLNSATSVTSRARLQGLLCVKPVPRHPLHLYICRVPLHRPGPGLSRALSGSSASSLTCRARAPARVLAPRS